MVSRLIDVTDLARRLVPGLNPDAAPAAAQRADRACLLDGGAGQGERGAAADEDAVQAVVADAARPVALDGEVADRDLHPGGRPADLDHRLRCLNALGGVVGLAGGGGQALGLVAAHAGGKLDHGRPLGGRNGRTGQGQALVDRHLLGVRAQADLDGRHCARVRALVALGGVHRRLDAVVAGGLAARVRVRRAAAGGHPENGGRGGVGRARRRDDGRRHRHHAAGNDKSSRRFGHAMFSLLTELESGRHARRPSGCLPQGF